MVTKKTETTKKKATATKKTSIKATKVKKELDVKDVVVEEAVKLDEAQKETEITKADDVTEEATLKKEMPKVEPLKPGEPTETVVDIDEPATPSETVEKPKSEEVKKATCLIDKIKKVFGIMKDKRAEDINKNRRAGHKWLSY